MVGKGKGQEGRISSQGALWAGSSLQVVKCWESPQPHSSPETKAGGCKVWQFGLQVLVSIHHPDQPSAFPRPLSQPHEEGGHPSSHLSARGHHNGACDMGLLVPEAGGGGAEGWGSRGTCPQAGRGWGEILRTGGRTMGGVNYCLVKERFLLSRIGIPQCLQVSFQF